MFTEPFYMPDTMTIIDPVFERLILLIIIHWKFLIFVIILSIECYHWILLNDIYDHFIIDRPMA